VEGFVALLRLFDGFDALDTFAAQGMFDTYDAFDGVVRVSPT
jgi:hypothetical protein